MQLTVVFYTGINLKIKFVKAARHFPLKIDKNVFFVKRFVILDKTAVKKSNFATSPPSGKKFGNFWYNQLSKQSKNGQK